MKKGFILTMIGAIFWAFSGACGQYLFDSKNLPEDWVVVVRMFSAGAILSIFCFFKDKNKFFDIFFNKKDFIELLMFSIFGIALCQGSYIKAIANSNAATATVLQYLGPIFIVIYVCVKQLKLPSLYEFLAIVSSIVGTFLLSTGGNINSLKISKEGLILGLISAFGLVFYTLIPQRIMKKYSILLCLGLGMTIGSGFSTIVLNPFKDKPVIDEKVIFAMILIVWFGTILAFYAYLKGVELIGPVYASLVACLEPVGATVFSAILGTKFTFMDILGIVLIILTITLLGLNSKKEN